VRFCRFAKNGLIGTILQDSGTSVSVRLFRSESNCVVLDAPANEISEYAPPPHSRCFVIRDGSWHPAIAERFTDTEAEIRSLGRKESVPLELVCLPAQMNEIDPAETLGHFGADDPSRFLARQAFRRNTLLQRRTCRGLTALLCAQVRLYEHQVRTVQRVMNDPIMRYILADEVGLGKTIEAGLIARQYLIDHPKRQVLVLVPEALESQWQEELERKVGLLPTAFRVQTFEEFLADGPEGRPSMTIIDEAHRLIAEIGGSGLEAIKSVCRNSEALLLLTATPVLNHEHELHAMLHLLAPDQYTTDGLNRFRELMSHRQEVGRILLQLNDDADPFEVELAASSLQAATPDDPAAQAHAAELKRLAAAVTSNGKELVDAVRRTRAYLNERYRINRRLLRARRESLPVNVILPRSEVIRLHPVVVDADPQAAVVMDLLETWRHWSLGRTVDDPEIAPAHRVLFRIFWTAFSAEPDSLSCLIRIRLGRTAIRQVPAWVQRSDSRTLSEVPTDADEREILERLLDAVDAAELMDKRCAAIVAVCGRTPGKGVVFTSTASTCVQVQSHLKTVLGNRVEALHGQLEPWAADESLDRFASDPACRVLVCDNRGEEGRNLQFANYAVFFDLPFDPFRIEQRCGRFDRLGQDHSVDLHVLVPPADSAAVTANWQRILADAFEVYAEPISSLQFYTDRATTHLIEIAYENGCAGLMDAIPSLRRELATERVRIREQDMLDASDPETGTEEIISGVNALNADEVRRSCEPWIVRGLRFNASASGNSIRYAHRPDTLVPVEWLPFGGAPYQCQWERSPGIGPTSLLRCGDPFFTAVEKASRRLDAGREYAYWRIRPAGEGAQDWFGFRIDLEIEGDIEPLVRVAEKYCFPISEKAMRRRLGAFFAPAARYLFLDTTLEKVDPQSDLFKELNRPYRSTAVGGTDTALRGDFSEVVRRAGEIPSFFDLCHQAQSRAVELTSDMPKLRAELAEASSRARSFVETQVEQLRCHEPNDWIRFETESLRALCAGLAAPRIRVDSIGFIALANRPIEGTVG
jgi:ATP-dependent helicase HepA